MQTSRLRDRRYAMPKEFVRSCELAHSADMAAPRSGAIQAIVRRSDAAIALASA